MMNTQQLLVLDDVWTSMIEDASKEPAGASPDVMAAVRQITTDMQVALIRAKHDAATMEAMLFGLGDATYEQAMAAVSDSPNPGAAGRTDTRDAFGEAGSRTAAIAACREIQHDADGESALLHEKLRAFAHGSVPAGDLRLAFRCALTLLAAAAAAVAVIGLGGSPVFVGLGVVSSGWFASRTWISDNCPMPGAPAEGAPGKAAPSTADSGETPAP